MFKKFLKCLCGCENREPEEHVHQWKILNKYDVTNTLMGNTYKHRYHMQCNTCGDVKIVEG